MSWTCPGHYKVHVYGRDSPGRPIHGHCPVPLPALPVGTRNSARCIGALGTAPLCISMGDTITLRTRLQKGGSEKTRTLKYHQAQGDSLYPYHHTGPCDSCLTSLSVFES